MLLFDGSTLRDAATSTAAAYRHGGTSRPLAAMPTGRSFNTATSMGDGRVLVGYSRKGEFTRGADCVSFTRACDRLELFEVVSFDRSPTRYALTRADGSLVEASCRGRQNTVTLGVLQGNAKPFSFECEWRQHPLGRLAGMTIAAPSWIPGTRAERSGSFTVGATTLEVKSMHNVPGSPLPQEQPIGYVMSHHNRPVGAIELNGSTPRLWRPAPTDALADPVTLAALALALLWDPAGAVP